MTTPIKKIGTDHKNRYSHINNNSKLLQPNDPTLAFYSNKFNSNLYLDKLQPFEFNRNLSASEEDDCINNNSNNASKSSNININMKIKNINFKNTNQFFKRHIDQFKNSIENSKSTTTLQSKNELSLMEKKRNHNISTEENIGGVIKKIKNELTEISKCIKNSEEKMVEIKGNSGGKIIKNIYDINNNMSSVNHTSNVIAKTRNSANVILNNLKEKNVTLENELKNIKNKFRDIELSNNYKDLYPVVRDTYEIDENNFIKSEFSNTQDENIRISTKNKKNEEKIFDLNEYNRNNVKIIHYLREKLNKYIPHDLSPENYEISYSYDCPYQSNKWLMICSKSKLDSYWILEDDLINRNFILINDETIVPLDKLELKYATLSKELEYFNKIKSEISVLQKIFQNDISVYKDRSSESYCNDLSQIIEKSLNFKENLNKLNQINDELNNEKNLFKSNLENKLMIISNNESKLKDLNKKIDKYIEENTILKKCNDDLNEKVKLNLDLKKIEIESKELISKLKEEIQYNKSIIKQYKDKFIEEQNKNSNLKSESKILNKQIENIPNIINDEIKTLKIKIQKNFEDNFLEKEINLKNQIKELNAELFKLEENYLHIMKENKNLSDKNLEILKDLISFDDNYKQALKRLEESDEKNNDLLINIEILNCQVSKLNEVVKEEKKSKEESNNNRKVLEEKIMEMNSDIQHLNQLNLKLLEEDTNKEIINSTCKKSNDNFSISSINIFSILNPNKNIDLNAQRSRSISISNLENFSNKEDISNLSNKILGLTERIEEKDNKEKQLLAYNQKLKLDYDEQIKKLTEKIQSHEKDSSSLSKFLKQVELLNKDQTNTIENLENKIKKLENEQSNQKLDNENKLYEKLLIIEKLSKELSEKNSQIENQQIELEEKLETALKEIPKNIEDINFNEKELLESKLLVLENEKFDYNQMEINYIKKLESETEQKKRSQEEVLLLNNKLISLELEKEQELKVKSDQLISLNNQLNEKIREANLEMTERDEKINLLKIYHLSKLKESETGKDNEINLIKNNLINEENEKYTKLKILNDEITELKKQNSNEIFNLNKKIEDLEITKNEEIKLLNINLSQLKVNSDDEMNSLRTEILKLTNSLNIKNEEIEKLKLEFVDKLKTKEDENTILKSVIRNLKEENEKEIINLNNSLKNLKKETEDEIKCMKLNSIQILKEKEEEIEILNTQIKKLDLGDKIDLLKIEYSKIINEKVEELKIVKLKIEELQKIKNNEVNELKSEILKMENKKNEEFNLMQLNMQENEKIKENEIKLLNSENSKYETKKEEEINALKTIIIDIEKNHTEEINMLRVDISKKDENVKFLNSENLKLIKQKEEELSELKEFYYNMETQKDQDNIFLKEKISKLEKEKSTEIDQLNEKLNLLMKKNKEEINQLELIKDKEICFLSKKLENAESNKAEELKILSLEITSKLAQKDFEIKNMKEEIYSIDMKSKEDLESANQKMNDVQTLYENQMVLIKSEYLKKDEEINQLKVKYSTLEKERETDIKTLKANYANIKAAKDDKIKILNLNAKALEKEKLRDAEQHRKDILSLEEKKNEEIINLKNIINRLEKEVRDKESLINENGNKFLSMEETIKILNSKLNNLNQLELNLENLREEKRNLENELTAKISHLNSELNIKSTKESELIMQIESLKINKIAPNSQRSSLEPEKYKSKILSLTNEIEFLKDKEVMYCSNAEKLENKLTEIIGLKEKILNDNNILQKSYKDIESRLNEKELKNNELENTIIGLRESRNKLENQTLSKIKDYEDKILHLIETIHKLEKEISDNCIIYQDSEIKIEKLQEDNSFLNHEISRMKSKQKEPNKLLASTESISNLNSSGIPEELQMKLIEIEIIKEELNKKDNILIQMKEDLINLQLKYADSKEEINKLSLTVKEKDKYIENSMKKNEKFNMKHIVEKDNNNNFIIPSSKITESVVKIAKTDKINIESEVEEEISNYRLQIANLKELIFLRDEEVQKLSKENSNYKNEIDKILNSDNDINKSVNSSFKSKYSGELNLDDNTLLKEKNEKYREIIENNKQETKLLLNQLGILKAEIKNYREKYENLLNFDGKIENYETFKSYITKVLENHKPKNKEYEDIYKKIKSHFSINFDIYSNNDNIKNTTPVKEEKKGFFGGIFNKNKK